MPETLLEIAARVSGYTHPSTKTREHYEVYGSYFEPLRGTEDLKLLEVGVHSGESLKVFAEYFSRGTIVGVDIDDRRIDFSAYPNILFRQANQTDRERLETIARDLAPNGFDIIVDDASHLGWFSRTSYDVLMPHLKSGGLYIVEDWGTGYIEEWYDGGAFLPPRDRYGAVRTVPKTLPSHDYGMVGFVKSLVDEVWAECIRPFVHSPEGPQGQIAELHFYRGAVVLRKR